MTQSDAGLTQTDTQLFALAYGQFKMTNESNCTKTNTWRTCKLQKGSGQVVESSSGPSETSELTTDEHRLKKHNILCFVIYLKKKKEMDSGVQILK